MKKIGEQPPAEVLSPPISPAIAADARKSWLLGNIITQRSKPLSPMAHLKKRINATPSPPVSPNVAARATLCWTESLDQLQLPQSPRTDAGTACDETTEAQTLVLETHATEHKDVKTDKIGEKHMDKKKPKRKVRIRIRIRIRIPRCRMSDGKVSGN